MFFSCAFEKQLFKEKCAILLYQNYYWLNKEKLAREDSARAFDEACLFIGSVYQKEENS